MDLCSTQQFESEQDIFDHNQMTVQLPSCHYSIYTQPVNSCDKGLEYQEEIMKGLNSTSKIPLNIGILDNTLFVSTLTREQLSITKKPMTCWEMKRQQYISSPIYYPKRRLSQPETQISSSCSSSSSSCTSIQSDNITLSTELIRRFSSGSTTSTVATSISASSLPIIVDAQTTEDKMKLINHHHQEQEISQEENNILNQQQLGHDPGHARDTMHSPYKLQHNNNNNKSNEAYSTPPIWADPIKIKENPTRYEKVKNYMEENQIPITSELPLLKACVFYFSDTNIKQQCYMSAVKSVFQCDTVWQFSARWRIYKDSYSKKPSQLLSNQNLFCFIKGVEPMWEDKVNENGGRLIITIQNNQKLLDDLFELLLCSFIGAGLFDYGVVGIVVSRRNRGDRIELWLDQSNSTNQTISLFKNYLCNLLPSNCYNEINASRYKKHF